MSNPVFHSSKHGPRIREYVFFRAEGFYPIAMANDADAIENAEFNPGTETVMDALTGKIIWESQERQTRGTSK